MGLHPSKVASFVARPVFQGALVLLLPVGWALRAGLSRWAPDTVERLYAQQAFPRIRAGLAQLSSSSPWSLAQLAVGGVLILAIVGLGVAIRSWRRRRVGLGHAIRSLFLIVGASAGVIYVVFLGVWGILHARPPLSDRLGLSRQEASVESLQSLVESLIDSAAERRSGLGEDALGVFEIGAGRADLIQRAYLAMSEEVVPGIVGRAPTARVPWSSPVLSALGISGIYSPFTGEAHVNGQIPDVSFPFTLLHELAHGAGEVREDDANFTAWLWCEASDDPELRYSGAFVALSYAMGALARVDRPAYELLRETLPPPLLRDRAAVSSFWKNHRTDLSAIARGVNDAYLRSQGQSAGVQSYGQMVDLLLASRAMDEPHRLQPAGHEPNR